MESVRYPVTIFLLNSTCLRVGGDTYKALLLGLPRDTSFGARIAHLCPEMIRNHVHLQGAPETNAATASIFTHLLEVATATSIFYFKFSTHSSTALIGHLYSGTERVLSGEPDRRVNPGVPLLTENRVILLMGMASGAAVTYATSSFLPETASAMLGVTAAKIASAIFFTLRPFVFLS